MKNDGRICMFHDIYQKEMYFYNFLEKDLRTLYVIFEYIHKLIKEVNLNV